MVRKSIYIVGGRQKAPGDTARKKEWHHYERGVIVRVDLDSGRIAECTQYVSPPEVCPDDDPSILFKSGTLRGERLYVCTQTEVLVYRIDGWELESCVSVPSLNDVHHVLPLDRDRLIVVNTGLDMVLELRMDGEILNEWSVVDSPTWDRFSRDVDYRKVLSTKPHQAHPNFAFIFDGELWVTRGDCGDARCLTDDQRPDMISRKATTHDGVVRGDSVYFTSVDGFVTKVNGHTGEVDESYDLNQMYGLDRPLGWCRGLEFLEDGRVVVGFSRLRRTKWKTNVQWLKHSFGGDGTGLLATRAAVIDLDREEVLEEIDLEPAGLNAVFSIHLASG